MIYTEKAQGHIDRALELRQNNSANQENNLQQPEKSLETKTMMESEAGTTVEEESLERTERKTDQSNYGQVIRNKGNSEKKVHNECSVSVRPMQWQ